MFRKKPLAWQVFDAPAARRAGASSKELVAELLQSPILYITGHEAPRFNADKRAMLKEYVDNGGFIFAEACCESPDFDKGFRDLMDKLEYPLKPLPANHPIWRAKFVVSDKEFPLYGVELCCKTVVIYCGLSTKETHRPTHLSCRWELNDFDKGKGKAAFRLGANIIAYATGMELPRDRGSKVEMVRDEGGKKPPRGTLKVAQLVAPLKPGQQASDWQPAPRAMPNLMAEMENVGLKVDPDTASVAITARDVVNFKFLYMHRRGNFSFTTQDLKYLQFNLQKGGGLLFADAACGSKEFDESFRKLVRDLFDQKLQPMQPILLTDTLFSKELSGAAIKKVRCRRLGPDGKTPELEFRSMDPELEGIKVNGRWVVIYSKYDIGCALEKQPSTDCLGHDHASAVQLGKAIVLYFLKR